MDTILALLLEVQRLQIQLRNQQQARSTRSEQLHVRPVVQPVARVTAPKSTVTEPAQSATGSDYRTQVESFILEETNAVRAQNGVQPLSADTALSAVARAHSADMLRNNFFAHDNLAGCSAGCRLTNAGYPWKRYGENIHWMSGYNLSARETAQKVVNDWLNSPPHRANLLGAFSAAGIGIAIDGTKIYTTTDYASK